MISMQSGPLSIFRRRSVRAHPRRPCRRLGQMILQPRDVEISGMVINISPAGCLFRPALHYLVQRNGDTVIITVADRRFAGHVVSTQKFGYGVKFEEEHKIDELIAWELVDAQDPAELQGAA
jgi:hypothetical protein